MDVVKFKKIIIICIICLIALTATYGAGYYTHYRQSKADDLARDSIYQDTIIQANADISRLTESNNSQAEIIGRLESRVREQQIADAERYRRFTESIRDESESVQSLDGTITSIGKSIQRIEQEISK